MFLTRHLQPKPLQPLRHTEPKILRLVHQIGMVPPERRRRRLRLSRHAHQRRRDILQGLAEGPERGDPGADGDEAFQVLLERDVRVDEGAFGLDPEVAHGIVGAGAAVDEFFAVLAEFDLVEAGRRRGRGARGFEEFGLVVFG